jgi:signal transduction histidine kinase
LAAVSMTEEQLLSAFLKDTLFSLLAGSILMNSGVWFALTNRVRSFNLSTLLAHVVTLTGVGITITVFAVLTRLGIPHHTLVSPSNFPPILILCWSTVLLTTLLGYRLAYIIMREDSSSSMQEVPLTFRSEPDLDEDYWSNGFAESPRRSTTTSSMSVNSERKNPYHAPPSLATGVCALDADGSFLYANDTFRAMTNIVLPGVCGKHVSEFLNSSPVIEHIDRLFRSTPSNRAIIDEVPVPQPQGGTSYIEISLRPHVADAQQVDTEGSTPRVITIRDITHRRQVSEHVLAVHRLKSLDSFVRGASVACSDIFSAIVGRATHGLHVNSPEVMRNALSTITALAHDGGTLTREIFELSSHENTPPAPLTCDLGQLLSERIAVWCELGGSLHPVKLQAPEKPLRVTIDVASLTHAVTELVDNARRSYGDTPGEISISLAEETIEDDLTFIQIGTRPGTFARIRVSDHGCGMSADVLERCTDPSWASTNESTTKGFGLSTVFSIVRQNGGFMTVESRQDKGTTVCLYLPLAEPDVTSVAQTSLSQHRDKTTSRDNTCQIMIIQQRDELRSVLSDMVGSLGFQHTAYSSCNEALVAPERATTGLIIVDETLGDAAIQQLIEGYKTNNEGCRALMLTVSPHTSHGCIPLCDELLIKPFNITDLRAALEASLAPRPHNVENLHT